MARKSVKLDSPVTLFAAIEQQQYESLRNFAFEQRRSIADVAREAIAEYLVRHKSGFSVVRAGSRAGRKIHSL